MPLSAKLVVVGGEVKSAEIKLRLPATIGRGRGATIMLPHPLVSRQHCELFETSGRLMVRDLGSLNGTFVNNERISEAPLPPGDLLTVGAVTFRAVYEVQEESAPPEGPGPQLKSGRARDTASAGTGRSAPKSAKETHPTAHASEPTVPFDDLELPVMPVDEGDVRKTDRAPAPPATKPEATVDVQPPADQTSIPPGAAPGPLEPTTSLPVKPDPGSLPATGSSTFDPPSNPDKFDFGQLNEEDGQSQPAGQDDDDFGDFLKSLGTK